MRTERLFNEGDYDFAASRAYYAIFYVTEAVLFSQGVFPTRLHDTLIKAFTRRDLDDYRTDPFPQRDAESLLQEAKEFIQAVEGYLRREKV